MGVSGEEVRGERKVVGLVNVYLWQYNDYGVSTRRMKPVTAVRAN